MIILKKTPIAGIDRKVLDGVHKYYSVARHFGSKKHVNSESEVIEEAVNDFLKKHPVDERNDLPFTEIIKKGPLGYCLKPREKRKLVNILKNEQVINHEKNGCLIPSNSKDNWYYVISGSYFERREMNSFNGSFFINQDLINEDEIFGEEFINSDFENYWESTHGSKLLRISPESKNELIKKIPKIKENLDYLVSQKFRKLDYLSTIRSNHLNSEDKVRYSFNFLVNRLGMTINGEQGKRKVSINFHGQNLPMGFYSDYGVLKRIMFEDIGDLVSLSRESVSRVLHNKCFQLNGINYRFGFVNNKKEENNHLDSMSNGNLYIFKNLLNTDGKIIKLTNLVN